ncbi:MULTISPECIES: hypothetical protein [unclassified Paenibacillus]|uniref:hypothetical protein n=1 Tax=unclassified Paenibacillus TaxID=185978 RepID=UPI00020D6BF4|nr:MULTISPECIES: hypothetical protein [unclassified Paenibacillus]EGL16474.1 hypothetical protein HMPREF9413_2708 [Paenibacillus sp. HGF7]EPD89066.1 hypothetical protein HMPREF1207_01809 [Paenibacillus sp. HGH0039]
MKKNAALGTLIIMSLLIAIGVLGYQLYQKSQGLKASVKPAASNPPVEAQTPAQAGGKQEEQASLVLAFEQALYAAERSAGEAKKEADREIGKMNQNVMPDSAVILKAYDQFSNVAEKVRKIPVPAGLNPAMTTELEAAKEKYAQAYDHKAQGMYSLMDYINTTKAGSAVTYGDHIKQADALLFDSVGTVIAMQQKLGVDFSKKETPAQKTQTAAQEPVSSPSAGSSEASSSKDGSASAKPASPSTDKSTSSPAAAAKPVPSPSAAPKPSQAPSSAAPAAQAQEPLSIAGMKKGYFGGIEFGLGTDFKDVVAKWGKVKQDQHREGGAGYLYKPCNCSIFVGKQNKISAIELNTPMTLQKVIDRLGKPWQEGWDPMDDSYMLVYQFSGNKELYVETQVTTDNPDAPPPPRSAKTARISLIQK